LTVFYSRATFKVMTRKQNNLLLGLLLTTSGGGFACV
jgi:hypothetical protein